MLFSPPFLVLDFDFFCHSAQMPRRGMWEGFQSSRQSRAAHARTQGSSPGPHARRCMNCIHRALNQNSPSKLPFLLHAPTTPMPCSNAQFFLKFFLSPCLFTCCFFFSLFVVYSTWAQVSAGTLQPSITGQGQFSSIVVVQVRRYDYASFTMLPPRHSLLSLVL